MREFLAVAKALSDENRVRALMALTGGELCVCQLVELLGLAPSTVSKHMSVLYQARLVESRKDGRWMYYRLPEDAEACSEGALVWVRSCLAGDKAIRENAHRTKAVRKASKEALCECYRT
ncbi:MAG: winged helix-turn-helix transcriptional regulator [Planctomycetes bacterium]|nr:winged helix-turn-helix transcriptional regulator [Planctomycetota bacterium]